MDVKFAPINPFSSWIDINRVSTDFRITVLHVTIDGLSSFCNPYFLDFHSLTEQFERAYAHLKPEFPWFFSDYIDDRL